MDNKQRIKSPEGVTKLMEELWKQHKKGLSQPRNNMFLVDLPPLTDEEKAEIEARRRKRIVRD